MSEKYLTIEGEVVRVSTPHYFLFDHALNALHHCVLSEEYQMLHISKETFDHLNQDRNDYQEIKRALPFLLDGKEIENSQLCFVPKDSEFYNALVEWHKERDLEIELSVRAYFEDDDNVWFFINPENEDPWTFSILGGQNFDDNFVDEFETFLNKRN